MSVLPWLEVSIAVTKLLPATLHTSPAILLALVLVCLYACVILLPFSHQSQHASCECKACRLYPSCGWLACRIFRTSASLFPLPSRAVSGLQLPFMLTIFVAYRAICLAVSMYASVSAMTQIIKAHDHIPPSATVVAAFVDSECFFKIIHRLSLAVCSHPKRRWHCLAGVH